MRNRVTKAEKEFEILEKTVEDPIILPFKKEILALVKAFGESGQSGGSASYTAGAISQAVKTLCMQEPLLGITGGDEEWMDITEASGGEEWYQNNRCSAVFKKGKGGKPYYLDAIIWQGEEEFDSFTGTVEGITSSQYIKFPFTPKPFYIDVYKEYCDFEWFKNNDINYHEENSEEGKKYYRYRIKDKKQLDKVFNYYEYKDGNKKQ